MFYSRIIFFIFLATSAKCNNTTQKCGCSIITIGLSNQESSLKSFDQQIPLNEMNKIDLLAKCELDCRKQLSLFLSHTSLENLNLNSYNLDNIPSASDKLCALLNKPSNGPGLITYLKVENLENKQSYSKLISIGRLCCTRPCSCALKSKFTTIKNFQSELSNQSNKGYACNQELNNCETECRNLVSNYYGYDPIKNSSRHLANIYQDRTDLGESMCTKESTQVHKPGIEYFISIQTTQESIRNIYLGKVCCRRPCDCKLYKTITNKTELFQDINSYLPARNLNYYDCNNEDMECLKDCRIAAGGFFKNEPIKDMSQPVSNLDIFSNFNLGADVCQKLNMAVEDPGVSIFLRYSTAVNLKNPIKEDLKVGRICCKSFFESYLPSNKCGGVGLPI